MHLYLSSIITLVVLTAVAAEKSCQCHFTGKSYGTLDFYVPNGTDDKYEIYLLQEPFPYFIADFSLQRVRFLASGAGTSEYIQDLQNNTMYRFPVLQDGSEGPCTKFNLTKYESIRFPTCLPEGWVQNKEGSYVPKVAKKVSGAIKEQFDVDTNGTCTVYSVSYVRFHNTSTPVEFYLEQHQFWGDLLNLINDNEQYFRRNTDNCKEADFDSLLRTYY